MNIATLEAHKSDLSSIMQDSHSFQDFIYTPLSEALIELKKRKKDIKLNAKIKKALGNDIPVPLKRSQRLVLLRYLITPNYEILRFLHIAEGIPNIRPLLCEYPKDKFVPSNISKRMLGKLSFFEGRDKNGNIKTEGLTVINFEESKNKKISKIRTLWGQTLASFHHQLFKKTYKYLKKEDTYDISSWYYKHGKSAHRYYDSLLLLFVKHGILFENFLLHDKEESAFIKDVFLPAFINAYILTGKKPLIVAFEPTETESDKFWLCYPPTGKKFVKEKIATI